MPRYDDYDDDYDDRPRRRKSRGGGNGSLWLILGAVGGVILLVIVGCAGFAIWTVNRASEGFEQMMTAVVAQGTADNWLEDLRSGRTKQAYDATSDGFKARQSQQQFEQLLARNPTLAKHTYRTPNFDPNQGADDQPVVIRFRLHTSDPDEDFMDEDDEDFPRPKRPGGMKTDKGKAVPEIDVTVTLVKEGGVWKVDSITIP